MESAALNTDRELWRSSDDYYADRVFVTEVGSIGMKADFGRVIVKRVGEWCYLSHEVEQLKGGYASFPTDVALVMRCMVHEESVPPAADISSDTGIPEKRVKEIQRALKVLGLARFGVLCDGDSNAYIARGSGYWLSCRGDDLATALHASGIETRSAKTEGLGPQDESPTGEAGDAQ